MKYPLHRILTYLLAGGLLLYLGRPLLVPLSFGLFISLLLYPLCEWMERRGLGRTAAIALGLFSLLIPLTLLGYLLVSQLLSLGSLWPDMKEKLVVAATDLGEYVDQSLQISRSQRQQWIRQGVESSAGDFFRFLQSTLSASVSSLVFLILVPIYSFLILLYRGRLVRAVEMLVAADWRPKVRPILRLSIRSFFEFIKGMLLVYLIVGLLNSIGLLLLGIPHALLFGFIASILTFIPYVGIMIAALPPIAVSWITYNSIAYPLGVVAIYAVVQYFEANLIFPWAVGRRVNLNTLSTIVSIVLGGIVWGGAGMILFIPFVAIAKLIAEQVEGAEALVLLLGDDEEAPLPKQQPE
ncbi:putative PurR-regulated permease PerM [Rhabdobacter roseus]|uniref:Putative PurR-regulated permease PerM n=1 Tax=Rhabdobacter roseus TaxID=1655419 RepID=A0A840TMH3_9BACT|nr:AI-2E family transporter [Rhabdobacter roseus]MBB5282752.1 putative PurR-regulated permease PerM [Rhabdobacter roseus]